MKVQKLGIIGLGHVGEMLLQEAVHSQLYGEIVLIDLNKERAWAQGEDHAHATGLNSRANIKYAGGDDYQMLTDADIIMVAATFTYPPGEVPADRQELLRNNASIMRQIMSDITAVTKEAIIIFIGNPNDTIVHMAATEFGYAPERILGTGCHLETSRMKYQLGRRYGVSPQAVGGYFVGEHGATTFPLISRVSVAGVPFEELGQTFPEVVPFTAEELRQTVVDCPFDIFRAKGGVTDAAVSAVAHEIARAILLDEQAVYSVSVSLQAGQYGREQAYAMSTPCVIGRQGVERILEYPLTDWEQTYLEVTQAVIGASIQLADALRG